jgi:steroid delta-isomerase-like uncharacterized protein
MFLMNLKINQIATEFANRIWNEKDLNAVDELVDSEVVIHSLLGNFNKQKAMRDVIQTWLNGFPDLRVTNDLVLCENDVVCVQWRAKGTHRGEFKGKKPTGKSVSYSGVTLYRIKNSKIVEYWAYLDMQHLLSQIE